MTKMWQSPNPNPLEAEDGRNAYSLLIADQ